MGHPAPPPEASTIGTAPPPPNVDVKVPVGSFTATITGEDQAKTDFKNALSGGWQFDSAQMQGLIDKLEEQHNKIATLKADKDLVTVLEPPGTEVASEYFVGAAKATGAAFQQAYDKATEFLFSYANIMKQIKDAYEREDQHSLDKLLGNNTLEKAV